MRRMTAALALSVAFGLVACDSATSPETWSADTSASPAPPEVTTVEAAVARNAQSGIERAEFRDGFCSVAISDDGVFTVYSGSSKAVATESGNINYHCNADVLFGPGPDSRVHVRDATFFDFSFVEGPLIIEPCDVRVTPHSSGQAHVNCHVGPRGGQAFNPDEI